MNKQYDMAVFVGRFEPFHNGHKAVIDKALEIAKEVVVIIGSSGAPRNQRNPFTYQEREDMVLNSFSKEDEKHIHCAPLEDTIYNDELWVKNIQEIVAQKFQEVLGPWHPLAKVTLIGNNKDNTSFYLKLFPQWESTSVKHHQKIDATDIRDFYFHDEMRDFISIAKQVPDSTLKFLRQFKNLDDYKTIVQEKMFIKKYKESWADAPFPPVFVTVDAVVVQSGHILLVRRGALPGKGLFALPGGFLNNDEKIVDGILRELVEETKIKVPLPVLKGSIVARDVFDDPNRSARGRTITHAALIYLTPMQDLPKVKGSDDAQEAKWFPLADVKRSMMFEDHYSIIFNLTQRL